MKQKLLLAAVTLFAAVFSGGGNSLKAQASYNASYTEGVEVAAGSDYFLYNIGSGTFLTGGMDWGSHASGDHAGKKITLATVGEGAYTIYTAYYSANGVENSGYLTAGNSYTDNDGNNGIVNWVFTPVEVNGCTNAYTIKEGNNYLYYNASDTRVQTGDNTGDNYSNWLIIPKSARDNVGDYTYYIQNQGINRPWERQVWCGYTWDQNNRGDWKTWDHNGWSNHPYYTVGGNDDNPCAEKFHQKYDFYQTITGSLPEGRYRLNSQAFWRDGSSGETYLYMGDAQQPIVQLNAKGENTTESMAGASTAFSNGQYVNSVEKFLSSATANVRFGINMTTANQWVIWDNFHLQYLGKCVMDYATELPSTGEMVADTWYYFDIAVAGNNYNATASELDDIICVTDGYTLTSVLTGDVSLDEENNSLAAQRYYVKSSSANILKVAPAAFTYTVGSATADRTYIQPGQTVTISYADLVTSDPNANPTLNFNGVVTFDESAITTTSTANGFTFEVPANLATGTDFTLTIPAEAIGYSEDGGHYNAAQDITLKTPAVFDGVYYMYNTYTKTYISRAGNYNTQAILDTWGLAFNVSTDAENNTQLQYFDSQFWLGDDGFCYGDCTGNRVRSFNVTAVEGGYKFLNTNNSKYLAANNGAAVGDAVEGDNLVGTSNVWALESTADHVANYTRNADAQASAAAIAAGLSGITTKAALDAELAANYGTTSITITGSKAEKFQQYPGNNADSGPLTYYSETVNNLKPGLYKLSVDAFQRAAGNERVAAADGARSLIYLYAGDVKTQLMSVMDYGATTAYSVDFSYNGKHYPDDQASAYVALETGNYANDVYVYVADAGEGVGSLEIGIKNPTRLGGSFKTWAVYNNWTLTRYEVKATTAEKTALADAISAAEEKTLGFDAGEYAPYNNVAGCEALAAAKAIDPNTASGEAVVAATTALTSATWTANTADVDAIYDGDLANAPIQATSENVVLPGWVTKNGNTRQTFKGNGENGKACLGENEVGLFVHPGTYNYGETTGYTMPLKAGCVYVAEAKYCSWAENSNDGFTLKILKGDTKVAEKSYGENNTACTTAGALKSVELYFTPSADGDYTLSVSMDGNTFMTGFHITKASSITIDEAVTYANTQNGVENVILKRTIRKGANTLVLPFDMTQEEVKANFGEEAKVYVISGFNSNSQTISFAEQEEGVKANVPCVLEATKEGSSFLLTDRTLVASATAVTTVGNLSMIGTYAPMEEIPQSNNNYILYNDNLYYVNSVVGMDGTRAYFKVEGVSGTRVLSVVYEGDEATEIAEIDEEPVEDGVIYNLAGQVVGADYKGIAIINGKKVLLK